MIQVFHSHDRTDPIAKQIHDYLHEGGEFPHQVLTFNGDLMYGDDDDCMRVLRSYLRGNFHDAMEQNLYTDDELDERLNAMSKDELSHMLVLADEPVVFHYQGLEW